MAASKRKRRGNRRSPNNQSQIYLQEYCAIAKKMLQAGATVTDLAEEFEVSPTTIRLWQKEHEEFAEACRLGKLLHDRRAVDALYQRALGYELEVEKLLTRNGEVYREKQKVAYPPDPAAGKFWLLNRSMMDWSKKPESAATDSGATKKDILRDIAQSLTGTALRPVELPDESERS
jgi:transposase-like protein